jgi:phage terminase Nu1 subunit (DNA packaging protein)
MTIKLNRSDLAQHMGVTTVTIDTWRKNGMPVLQAGSRGVEWSFDLTAVIKWHVLQKVKEAAGDAPDDLAQIEKRTASAKMQRAELELAKARGEVAPIRDFERAQEKAFAEIRSNVMNVPQRVVIQLLGETNEAVFKKKLKAELTLALQAAAEADLTLEAPDGIGGELSEDD